ncbi:DUF4167 domain-containing protein [Azospirillum canadense]|uniref:DUF4167 domain-containing protein n=1 Tax=Azospirillum canadense TaxID=403962 RepID=UPI0029CAAF81|nr:DUF4167 domain-containing protein [Azospirillum canadense]
MYAYGMVIAITETSSRMPFDNPRGARGPKRPRFGQPAPPQIGSGHSPARPPARVGGSAQQKQAQWLARAADAERRGDAVEAELCRQYAEHWYRVEREFP